MPNALYLEGIIAATSFMKSINVGGSCRFIVKRYYVIRVGQLQLVAQDIGP